MQGKDDFFSSPAFLQALAIYEEQENERLDAELAAADPQALLNQAENRSADDSGSQ